MTGKVDNIIRIPTSVNTKFFRYWMEFLQPFHKLSSKESDVAALFLKHRYLLSKAINDNGILDIDKLLMSEDTKRKIREEINITPAHFQVIMSKLRKGNFIQENRVNPKFIPNVDESSGYFKLLLLFDLQ